jgi:hypothetical protein
MLQVVGRQTVCRRLVQIATGSKRNAIKQCWWIFDCYETITNESVPGLVYRSLRRHCWRTRNGVTWYELNIHNAQVSISSDKIGKQLIIYEPFRHCGMEQFRDEELCNKYNPLNVLKSGELVMDWAYRSDKVNWAPNLRWRNRWSFLEDQEANWTMNIFLGLSHKTVSTA